MSETERCYNCGRVKCDMCVGTGIRGYARRDGLDVPVKCDCEDGWRETRIEHPIAWASDPANHLRGRWLQLGTDPAVLCPKCKKEREVAARGQTHYEECWRAHKSCAMAALRSIMEEMVGGVPDKVHEAHIKTALHLLSEIWDEGESALSKSQQRRLAVQKASKESEK